MPNTYTEDRKFIIDASGKPWAVETWHRGAPPKEFCAAQEQSPNTHISVVVFWDHWLARAPLPTIPKPKTQEEMDEEVFEQWHQRVRPILHEAFWNGMNRARKGAQ